VTNTVTLLPDHKGFTKPRAVGDEYIALGSVAISSYRTGTTATAASQTITSAAAKKYTRAAGSYIDDGFVVGDHVVIEGSAANNNDDVIKISALSATVFNTLQVVAAESGDGDEQVTHAGEKILASSFGLDTITSIELVGQSDHDCHYIIGDISADKTFFYLYAYTTGSAALLSASLQSGDLGTVKLKVFGNL
tara:strand:- start:8922 stop:9500 length:579 start_codon:yes stop_codon:yes gene_type:complete